MPIETVNPYNNRKVKSFDEISDEQLENKLEKAHQTYQKWKITAVKDRADLLLKVASIMKKRKKELAELITLEMGKLIAQSEAEIDMCISVYEYYAKNGESFLKDQPIDIEDGKAFVRLTPIGIIMGVMPWNYPFNQVARIAAPNIVAGNVMVVKHASNVPQCAKAIEDIFGEAGAEEGIYTNLFIGSKRVAKLAEDKRIAGMSLTGSEGAGSSLAEAAGKNLKKSVLELGGSDPFIVLEDANLENAVENAVKGRFGNMGQACTSSKRIILLDGIADDFIQKFKSELEGLKVGDPLDEATEVGPLSTEEAAEKIEKQVKETIDAGAKVLLGGKRMDREGAFFEPTILTDIKKGMTAYHEEIFGPVASIFRVNSEDEAIELANDSSFGLGGSVFSENVDRALKVADKIETGMVFINEHTASRPDLPFGGIKRSGYGRELSALGFEEFLNKKLIRVK